MTTRIFIPHVTVCWIPHESHLAGWQRRPPLCPPFADGAISDMPLSWPWLGHTPQCYIALSSSQATGDKDSATKFCSPETMTAQRFPSAQDRALGRSRFPHLSPAWDTQTRGELWLTVPRRQVSAPCGTQSYPDLGHRRLCRGWWVPAGKGLPPPTPRPCPARARRRPRAGQGKPLSAVLIPARLRAAAPSAPRGAPGPPLTPGPAHVLGVSGRARGQLRGGLIAAAKWTGEEVGFKGGKGSSRSHASPAVLARLGTGERAELSLTIWVQTGPFHEGWVHASPLPGHRHGTNNEWHKVSYSSCMWTRRWKPWGSRCMFKALVANTGRAGTSASYGCLYALVSESHLYMFVQH